MREENKNSNIQPRTVVGGYIFNDIGELLLLRQPRWNNKYVCIGGGVRPHENLLKALKREVKEEANLEIKDIKFLNIFENSDAKSEYSGSNKNFIAINHTGRAKSINNIKLGHDSDKFKWMPPKDWLKEKNLEVNTKKIIEKYLIDKEDYKHKYQRALADYQNLLKRTAVEKADFAKYANEGLLMEILPVFDNLKMSLKHFNNKKDNNSWAEGIKFVVKQFEDALQNIGVETVKTKGKKFDPLVMDAVEGKGEKVLKEVKPGYRLNGKVIVAAKVILE